MTDVTRPTVRKTPDPSGSGHQTKLRARKPPGWRAKPPVPTSSTRFQAVPFSKSTPTRGPPLSAVPFNNSTPTRTPVPPAALPSTACQSPEVNPNHHDNSQSGASLIPSPSEAVRSVMTGAMRLTGLVRETMVKVTHAASATTSVVTRTCCAENTKTESSHHTATFSAARQTESYQMAIPTDDHVEAGPRPLGKASIAAIPSNNSAKTGPNAPLTKKTKALPVRKVAPFPQKSEKEPSTEASPVERQDSQPDQELGQTYSVADLRKLFGETYSVDKPEQSPDFSSTYKVAPQGKDLGSTFVVRTENVEEVGALPYDSTDTVRLENAEEVCAQPFDKDFNKGRKLCLMAIPTEPHEEEESQSQGATNSPQPPSLTDAMESVVVKDILQEGYSLDLVRHAVWRRLNSAGGLASRPELLQAVKDLEQEYTAAEKKLGDKDFLKERDEVNLALAMERREVKVVLSQGHDLETVRHVVWRRLQEGKGHFKSAPKLLQAVSDLKREYEQANKKLADAEKTFNEKTVEYEGGGGKTADATSAERVHRSNSVADAMANPVVGNVLSAGYSRELVQHAVWRRLETHGENFASVAELLQALKDLEDESARAKEKLGNDELPSIPPAVTTATDTPPEPENVPSTEDIPPSPTTDNGLAQTTDDRCKVTTDDNVESELERYREEHTCKVCFDARIEVVFVPCGHYACCGHCADGMVECPMCRRGVDSTVKVFFS